MRTTTDNHNSRSFRRFSLRSAQAPENEEVRPDVSLRRANRRSRPNAQERDSIIRSFYELNRSVRVVARMIGRPEAQVEVILRQEKERVASIGAKCKLLLAA